MLSLASSAKKLNRHCRTVFPGLILFAVTLWAAWSTMDRSFMGDDFGYVGRFLAFPWARWPSLFVTGWAGDIWGYPLPELRPFAALSFMVDGALWGINPLGYHLTNWILSLGCSVLVCAIARSVRPEHPWWGIAAGGLFALYPAHVEAVCWITGRVDLLGTFFCLLGFYAALTFLRTRARWAAVLTWMAYGAGVFSKEFCLTLPVLVVAFQAIYPKPAISRSGRALLVLLGGYIAVFLSYLACRHLAFGSQAGGGVATDFFGEAYLERQTDYLGWMFPPLLRVVQSHREKLVALSRGLVPAFSSGFVVTLMIWRWRSRTELHAWRAALFFGFAWYWIATLPLVVVTYFSSRHLFFATAGASISFVLVLGEILRPRWAAPLAVAAAVIFFAAQSSTETARWRHAAKVSERISRAVRNVQKKRGAATALVLDVPAVVEGCWTWSWSSPFALTPPFMEGSSSLIIERPSVFFFPSQWRQRHDFSKLAQSEGAYVMSLTAQNVPTTRLVNQAQLQKAVENLASAPPSLSDDQVWTRFLTTLDSP